MSTTAGPHRARAVAAAGERLAAAHGAALPDELRLWRLAGIHPPVGGPPGDRAGGRGAVDVDGDDLDLAAALEAATSAPERRTRGLHVTPRWLADHLVGLVTVDLSPRPRVCDPACGGGAFLLAAARALHTRGVPRCEVVRDLLWGADVDPVGLAAAEAALAIWSGGAVPPPGRLVVANPLHEGAAVWAGGSADGFDLVVGNPPFQSQLGRATARKRAEQLRLRERFGPAVRAYTDAAWLFLLLGCQLARPDGRVVMVQPDSLVAARDAGAVRAEIDGLARLERLWVDDGRAFAAAVRVCAPVLRRCPSDGAQVDAPPGTVQGPAATPATRCGPGDDTGRPDRLPTPAGGAVPVGPVMPTGDDRVATGTGAGTGEDGVGAVGGQWHDLLADASGVPPLEVAVGAGRLGDRATMLAGFRDEYYGLVPAVCEADTSSDAAGGSDAPGGSGAPGGAGADGAAGAEGPVTAPGHADASSDRSVAVPAQVLGAVSSPLVTVGAIDWGRSAWGHRPVRFAKTRWRAPVVDHARLDGAPPIARRWVARTRCPKVLVATQTKVVEVAVDAEGTWVPSVPVIAVVPDDVDELWHVAAALAAPAATVWLLRRAPGVALARGALKVAARDLAALPRPPDAAAWDAAAGALRSFAGAPSAATFAAFTDAAAAAYTSPDALVDWWRARLGPLPVA